MLISFPLFKAKNKQTGEKKESLNVYFLNWQALSQLSAQSFAFKPLDQ